MQRLQQYVGRQRPPQLFLDAPDVAGAGKKDQHRPRFHCNDILHHPGNVRLECGAALVRTGVWQGGALGRMARLYRPRAPFTAKDRGIAEELGNSNTIERGRHDQDAEIVAQRIDSGQRERKTGIAHERALMKFIEDHQADAVEGEVVLQHPGEDPLGDHLDAGAWSHAGIEAHPITHRLADPLAERCR